MKRLKRLAFFSVFAVVTLELASHVTRAAEFFPLGYLDENNPTSDIFELSGDGSTVIGQSPYIGPPGYRWTRDTGMVELPHVPGFPVVYPQEISHDGQIVFGMNQFNVGDGTRDYTLFRWTEAAGIVNLGNPTSDVGESLGFSATTPNGLASAGRNSRTAEAFRWTQADGFAMLNDVAAIGVGSVQGISDDGSVVMGGAGEVDGNHMDFSFRWTEASGLVDITPGFAVARQNGISADGNTIVGGVGDNLESLQPYVWTVDNGLQVLEIPSPWERGRAFDVTPDGHAVVGLLSRREENENRDAAFLWTEETGAVEIEAPDGWDWWATSISDDGRVIVGRGSAENLSFPVVWTENIGVRNLNELLGVDFGLSDQVGGWALGATSRMSVDGTVFAGWGESPDGNPEAWVAIIPELIETVLPGDYNGNGQVEQADLDLVLLHWGDEAANAPSTWITDLPTGMIDQNELDKVLLGWGNFSSAVNAASVPEPSGLALFAACLVVLACLGVRRVRAGAC